MPTVQYVRGRDMGGGVGGLLYTVRSESGGGKKIRYNLSNGRGDIVAQSDANTALTWTASNEAYGKRTKETGVNQDKQRANSKDEDPTGLLNEGFRYRDIETGVWLSRDPAGFVDGPNLYAYVRQNPWTGWDPHGLADRQSVGDVYDLSNTTEHYQGMTTGTTNTSSAKEDAETRVNQSGHKKSKRILSGESPQGFAHQVTVPTGVKLTSEQSKQIMEAAESQLMRGQTAMRPHLIQINEKSARYTADEAASILKQYGAEIGQSRPYTVAVSDSSVGLKWIPKISMFGRRVPVVKYAFLGSTTLVIADKARAGQHGEALYEAASLVPVVGEAQLAGQVIVTPLAEGIRKVANQAQVELDQAVRVRQEYTGENRQRAIQSVMSGIFGANPD